MVVTVVVDAANLANDVDAILIVDVLATLHLVDVVVYSVVVHLLCDFAMYLSNVMLDVTVLLEWLSIIVVDVAG